MHPNFFKYDKRDLHKKFQQIIETNHMINEKSNYTPPLPTAKNLRDGIKLDDSGPDIEEEKDSISLFSDMKNMSSTNISAVIQTPSDNILSLLRSPLESGAEIFNNIQNLVIFRKKDDEFYSYKMKIYNVR